MLRDRPGLFAWVGHPLLRVPPGGRLKQSIRSRAALLPRCAAYLSFVLNKYITSKNIRQTSARSIIRDAVPLCAYSPPTHTHTHTGQLFKAFHAAA